MDPWREVEELFAAHEDEEEEVEDDPPPPPPPPALKILLTVLLLVLRPLWVPFAGWGPLGTVIPLLLLVVCSTEARMAAMAEDEIVRELLELAFPLLLLLLLLLTAFSVISTLNLTALTT